MWRRLDIVWTDISEECIASIFRVENSSSEEPAWARGCRLQPPAHSGSSLDEFSTLKMEAIHSSERSVRTRSRWRHIPEDGILHSHRCENLKSYENFKCSWANRSVGHRGEQQPLWTCFVGVSRLSKFTQCCRKSDLVPFILLGDTPGEVKVCTYIHKDTAFSDIVLRGILCHTVILTMFRSGSITSDSIYEG
jgi:hypothetical protein